MAGLLSAYLPLIAWRSHLLERPGFQLHLDLAGCRIPLPGDGLLLAAGGIGLLVSIAATRRLIVLARLRPTWRCSSGSACVVWLDHDRAVVELSEPGRVRSFAIAPEVAHEIRAVMPAGFLVEASWLDRTDELGGPYLVSLGPAAMASRAA